MSAKGIFLETLAWIIVIFLLVVIYGHIFGMVFAKDQIEVKNDVCRKLAEQTAPLVMRRYQYSRSAQDSNTSNFRGNQSGVAGTLGGVQDYMIQSYNTSPSMSYRELVTLGYSYCMSRL